MEKRHRNSAAGTHVATETATHRPALWQVYIVQCADGSLYTGVTTDIVARLALHSAGKGAKYTRGRGPLALVYQEVVGTRGAALQREYAIKRLPTAAKRELIERWK